MREYKYKEGPKAARNFEGAMKTLFKAPKQPKKKKPPKAATSGKSNVRDRN
jgi:hypothetical protein